MVPYDKKITNDYAGGKSTSCNKGFLFDKRTIFDTQYGSGNSITVD